VFGSATGFAIFTGDGTVGGGFSDTITLAALSNASVGDSTGSAGLTYTSGGGTATSTLVYAPGATNSVDLSTDDLTTSANAQTALQDVYTAVQAVAAERGYTGAQINTLNAVSNVETTEQVNVTSAQNSIMATDYGAATSNLSKYEILTQTGISALSQANSTEQMVTKLLQ
jgi:flagellin